ncbi:Adenylate cyclase [hydrothermal vent metagenome]|uniref:Adenylate cyclase n=1 Tax=hydrothermal vent metagenome TaxID=652676 RepID=A0A3B0TV99_9ZZZZ
MNIREMGAAARSWATSGEASHRIRLASGLILFAFVLTHFLNHAVGLISVEAMTDAQAWRRAFWRFWPVTLVLYGALLVHILFAVWRLVRRRTLKMPPWEAMQIALGIIIPYQLGAHIVATRGLYEVHGVNDTYVNELNILWPGLAWEQSLLLLVVWVHSVMGIHFWLRLRAWYARAFLPLFVLAVIIPVLALLGWITAGREVALFYDVPPVTPEQFSWGSNTIQGGRFLFFVVVGGLAAALLGPKLVSRLRRRITVEYPGNIRVMANPGATLLEISRMNGIPHASVCGGRARCSTCRVRVVKGIETLTPADAAETTVLARIRADDHTRLACQIRPQEDIVVQPLVPARDIGTMPERARDAYHWGVEQPVAILFADIRGFTSLSENRLPFDIVHLLNRYCGLMAAAIEAHDGYVDKFIGDGVMAIFGISTGVKPGCEAALRAAADMGTALAELNEEFAEALDEPLRIGVGIHAGPAILGRIGTMGTAVTAGRAQGITALGDTVNIASRLESATKELGAVCVVSAQVLHTAGIEYPRGIVEDIKVKGREGALKVVAFADFQALRSGLAVGEP